MNKTEILKNQIESLHINPCACGSNAELTFHQHEDGHRYPKDFWYAKVECASCDLTQGWSAVSAQEAEWEEMSIKTIKKVINNWNKCFPA